MVRISVLDMVPLNHGQSTSQALASCFTLAKAADRLGYLRYWVAEQHNSPLFAATSPAVLIGMLAGQTEHLLLGAGGVILPNHPPLVVAEQFAMLEAAHPGRIDLGIGRSFENDQLTNWALRRGATEGTKAGVFASSIKQLRALLTPPGMNLQQGNEQFKLRSTPSASGRCPIWLLGTSEYSAKLAGELGVPYAYAHHLAPEGSQQALTSYRQNWTGSQRPRCFISVNVVVGRDHDEAWRLAMPYLEHRWRLTHQQAPQALSTVEQAEAAQLPAAELAALGKDWLIGAPYEVAEQIFNLADEHGLEEIMVNPVAGSFADDSPTEPTNRIFTLEQLAHLVGHND